MNALLSRCPVCAGNLHVTEVACNGCGTNIHSEFEPCRFCRLSQEQLQFVMLFLRNRGNITALGEELDISYPTVTRRLEAVLATLDAPSSGEMRAAPEAVPAAPPLEVAAEPVRDDTRDLDRRKILEMLDKGEITADEATRQLKDL